MRVTPCAIKGVQAHTYTHVYTPHHIHVHTTHTHTRDTNARACKLTCPEPAGKSQLPLQSDCFLPGSTIQTMQG